MPRPRRHGCSWRGSGEFLPGTGRGTARSAVEGHARRSQRTVQSRVRLHHPAGGPPPPVGEELAMTRCGIVAVIGAPNAGKSTLVNQLVGQKVAIVSAKAQTTRARLMGIALAKEH